MHPSSNDRPTWRQEIASFLAALEAASQERTPDPPVEVRLPAEAARPEDFGGLRIRVTARPARRYQRKLDVA